MRARAILAGALNPLSVALVKLVVTGQARRRLA